MTKQKNVAIILAAGQGKRMNTKMPKQYLLLEQKPILYYTIKNFQENSLIDEIILVTEEKYIEYCNLELKEKYKFNKITSIIPGGKERYESVYNALKMIDDAGCVLIHDGARPFISTEVINKLLVAVNEYKACVVGVKSKDTIKIVNDNQIVDNTPNRSSVYIIQTPQVFEYKIIRKAYDEYMSHMSCFVTDDSMVLEMLGTHPIKVIEGEYTNIKITTPEDLIIAEKILNSLK
ncbi:2-C-methyl-D-erythritol 4-phosphate cytidylyltransferase [Anaeromicropila herbilytica]|uniref:2-C-methyl-D-erythritol 4-phosphate cytidylyltransferase n=1 Tax=Anaeromicropila herbilytica TaxID=2785025 RepID=A0A7R7EJ64_9FIRM|nr:2-C-methyl-D-erythritol 4-phosphate cytidylyltransferase [Anaeromicropila herbilytica]BCN29671.1 2-C-methyl-D-erythritol 4-phosphate cytidylyltransferase [Anaeromicropila herbilytica]